jgi:hypothetical protein
MINEAQLREYVRAELEKILDEMTSTANVAGYLTPGAFRGNKKKNVARIKKIATLFGFSLTPRGVEQLKEPADSATDDSGDTTEIIKKKLSTVSENKYYEYRNDPTRSPQKKLADAISEINKQMAEIQKIVKRNRRLKTEYGIDSSKMWKRANAGLVKLEAKLIELAQQIREIRN